MKSLPALTSRLARRALAWLAAAVLVVGCGGGGGGDAPNVTGGAFTMGTISGFGSIIVGGVRFDDSRAQVVDDDDQPHDRGELKLGMTVEVLSDRIQVASAGASALARHIRFGAEIVGPVEAIDAAASQLTVLGQIVEVTDTTVFDHSLAGGVAALAVGDIVEVHAQFNTANGHYVAKRIEKEARANFFRLRGVVSQLDSTAKTFHIGGATISYAQVPAGGDLPPGFADGARVRVRLQTAAVAGIWQAVSIRSGVRKVEDHDEARVRGVVTAFTDITSFSVNGLPVTTSASTAFPDGSADIVVGAAVEVEGAIRDGVLVASEVELEDHHADDDDRLNKLHGTISALDATARTFVVREVKVHYGSNTSFSGGHVSDLANGKAVEVKGRLAADGVTLEAKEIKFEQ